MRSDAVADRARKPGCPLEVRGDDDLARLVARQGPEPFAVLYRRHRDELHRFCLRMLAQPHDAADAAQDAWASAYAALRRAPARAPFRPWIYTIARHACVDRMRGRSRASVHELSEADLPHVPGPATAHALRDELRSLLGDLVLLPPLQRSGIVMRDVAGLSHHEIADGLGISVARSRSLTSEARALLQDRRTGRSMPCGEVREQIGRLRLRNRRLRAHIDECAACRAFESRERGRRLSSLALAPWLALRDLAGRAATWVGPGPSPETGLQPLAAKSATLLTAATAALAFSPPAGPPPQPATSPPRPSGTAADVAAIAQRPVTGGDASRASTRPPIGRRTVEVPLTGSAPGDAPPRGPARENAARPRPARDSGSPDGRRDPLAAAGSSSPVDALLAEAPLSGSGPPVLSKPTPALADHAVEAGGMALEETAPTVRDGIQRIVAHATAPAGGAVQGSRTSDGA